MKSLEELIERFKRGPSDLIGIDVGSAGINAVRMRKHNDEISVLASAILPPVEVTDESSEAPGQIAPLVLPPTLKARYASITVSGEKAIVKLMSFPGHFDSAAEAKVVRNMGLEDPSEYRIAYKLITEGHGKSESKVLAVALPETDAQVAAMLLPVGLPAPFSIEISGLATMSAFLHGPGAKNPEDSVGVIHFGDNTSSFALFNKNVLALVRRFDLGTNTILDKVQETLGVDRETAQGIISDGSFDISLSVNDVMAPLVKQLIVSRDFVERREDCHVARMYVSGGLVVSHDSLDAMSSSMGVDVDFWNPFEGLTMMTDALPENLVGQEWRFSAAIGAGLGAFEET